MVKVREVAVILFSCILGTFADIVDCEGPPSMLASPENCCQLPQFFPDDVLKMCSDNYSKVEYQPPRKAPRAPPLPAPLLKSITAIIPRGCCVFECAFNATGINPSGGLDMTDIPNYFTGIAQSNAAWQDTMIDALEFCVRDTHSKLPGFMAIGNMPPNISGQKYCNPMAGYLVGCLHSFLFQHCPESLWQQSAECRELRTYQEKCPLPFGVNVQ
ncbi:general odorant-binding protein 66-like [Phlebotomus argentipes]|uniref:general odorant-binding protein 66-like n=1 Tax=Phlebotomus argentipes TaxID=94469 RepID=UPI002892D469|nr:general odorant-binding protein 66-like [Phlebotomus argentipes]